MVIFSHLPTKYVRRLLLHSRPWSRERNIKGLCLRRAQRKEGSMVQKDHFSVTFSLFLQWIHLGMGSGKWAQGLPSSCQLLKVTGPTVCPMEFLSPARRTFQFAAGLLVMASPSFSPTDPIMSLHSDLGLPEGKEDRAKKKSPRLRGNKFRLIRLERQEPLQYRCKIAHNFPVR